MGSTTPKPILSKTFEPFLVRSLIVARSEIFAGAALWLRRFPTLAASGMPRSADICELAIWKSASEQPGQGGLPTSDGTVLGLQRSEHMALHGCVSDAQFTSFFGDQCKVRKPLEILRILAALFPCTCSAGSRSEASGSATNPKDLDSLDELQRTIIDSPQKSPQSAGREPR